MNLIHILLDQSKLIKKFSGESIPDKGIKEREDSVETEDLNYRSGHFGVVVDVEVDEWAIVNNRNKESGN
jgi:hypothetical protein